MYPYLLDYSIFYTECSPKMLSFIKTLGHLEPSSLSFDDSFFAKISYLSSKGFFQFSPLYPKPLYTLIFFLFNASISENVPFQVQRIIVLQLTLLIPKHFDFLNYHLITFSNFLCHSLLCLQTC